MAKQTVPTELISNKILYLRGQKVMIDRDLAQLYGVETKYLNRQVNRNKLRFPKEFMFRLTKKEKDELVTNWHRFETLKHSSVLPYAFTEHGVAMLSSVLNSKKAVEVNIAIIKTFIRLRELMKNHKSLAKKIDALEKKYDHQFKSVFILIKELIVQEQKPKRKIGFK
jgi:hypothetical protein